MKPLNLARYHMVWAFALAAVTGLVFGNAVSDWWKHGQPPIYHYWFQQLIVVCGAYRAWYHFSAARKA
jgi:hypothetical protein